MNKTIFRIIVHWEVRVCCNPHYIVRGYIVIGDYDAFGMNVVCDFVVQGHVVLDPVVREDVVRDHVVWNPADPV